MRPYDIPLFEVILLLKRILLCVMTVLMLIPLSVSGEEEGNLLYNPGFEELGEDGLPLGWYTDAYILREGVSLYHAAEQAHSGSHAVVVENCDLNDARFAQIVEVEPNTNYRLSGWIRADGILDAGHGANLSVEGVHARSESLYDTDGEWFYVETYGRTGDDQTEVTVFARVGGYSGESQGSAAFDDLALVKVDKLPQGVSPQAWYVVQNVAVVNPVDAEASAEEPQPFWPWLIVIAGCYAAAALWLMRHIQLDRRQEALQEATSSRRMPLFVMAALAAAALCRILVALSVDGYQVDVNCFTAWGYTMSSVGPAQFYQTTSFCDYTPGYIYIMGLNGLVTKLLNGLVSASFVHKLIPMACDLIGAWLVYRLAVEHEYSRRQAGLLAMLLAFNPAIILNSAAWCQIDSVLCIGLMLVAYFAIHRKWALVLPLYVLCILVKPQALMLGFLGLAAIIMEIAGIPVRREGEPVWPVSRTAHMPRTTIAVFVAGVIAVCQGLWARRSAKAVKDMGVGLLISLVLALLIVVPFSPNQESPMWLIDLYSDTLASYPYATVNTANLYYLAGANWDDIANTADPGVIGFFLVFALGCSVYMGMRQRGRVRGWLLEPIMMAAYAVVYLVLLITGCSWTVLGIVAMSMAFVLILPMFIRSGKLEMLPLCGAAIFILLYVFGIKMHERYLFPALFLLGMGYAIHRDRRILLLLAATSCVLFVNEGIVLDNSIRLGSSMGHLNADTVMLANLLSLVNVACAVISVWCCHHICVESAPAQLSGALGESSAPVRKYSTAPCTPLNFSANVTLGLNRRDMLLMLAVTAVYAVVTLTTLGSTKAPQTAWKSTSSEERVYIDLGQHYEDFSMLYFAGVSYSNFSVEVRNEIHFALSVGEVQADDSWSEEYPAEMREGLCFSWQYLDPSYTSNGKEVFVEATDFSAVQKLSGRYVCINPRQAGLVLHEVIFKDAQGNIIPDVTIVGWENANERSPNYSDPANLLDEQNTLDGEPSWWNSTYFDEIYHARTAYEHLNQTTAYEWTHPPLGKVIMSWFIGIFGMTPFGWRFAGALCGILMLPAIYLLAKQLTKRTDMAFLAMMLMTLDCMHFTQTRLATIDSYPVLFIILSYFFMLRFMQRDIVLEDMKAVLPELALSGFFMGCSVASKWIGVYAGIGLAVLYFWTCIRHLRLGRMAVRMQQDGKAYTQEQRSVLETRANSSLRRVIVLCLWCLLFFVAVPLAIYLWAYTIHYSYMDFDSVGDFLKTVIRCQENILAYHGQPGMGMDHYYCSPWYEWPLMMKPMYYASASFKPEGMTYSLFCFGNPWVWLVGLAGIAYAVYRWARGHRYALEGSDGCLRVYRDDWNITPAFILIGLLAQFLPWVLVPRGTFIYHYFASVPFLILGTTLMFHYITLRHPRRGRTIGIVYLVLCLMWFVLLFPYASGLMTPVEWMTFIRDYPYITQIDGYWQSEFLVSLNAFLEKIPIFPYVYYH